MKKNSLSMLLALIIGKLIIALLIAACALNAMLMVTSYIGVMWDHDIKCALIETVFWVLIILIGGTVVIDLVSMRIIQPYCKLQAAIDEVSKGNLNIRLEYNKKDKFSIIANCFNKMIEELKGIDSMRNDVINAFSHECKIPIASIRGFAKQLQRKELSEEEKDSYLDIIITESERILNMCQNMLDLSRYENQVMLINQESFSLDEQLRECVILLQKDWNDKNLDIQVYLDQIQIYTNAEMLRVVWMNLLNNAIKFSSCNDKIEIHCKKIRDKVCVSIRDYGLGMDEITMKHMFDQFYSTREFGNQGNGIGLVLVKRIVELNKGHIRVNSKKGEGTEISVYLPL